MSRNSEKKKVGRPVKQLGIKKSYFVNIRMDTSLYYHLRGLALEANMTISECARGLILNSFVKQRISEEELVIIKNLIGMANNLNQLARSAHVYGFASMKSDNEEIAENIKSVIDKLSDR